MQKTENSSIIQWVAKILMRSGLFSCTAMWGLMITSHFVVCALGAVIAQTKITRGLPAWTVRIGSLFILMLPLQLVLAQDQSDIDAGERVFQTYCFACHGIGEAQRVGPDLAGVHDRRSQDWLRQFIRSPKTMLDGGDADAIALLGNFDGIVMPDSSISEQQILEVLAYIESRSSSLEATSTAKAVSNETAILAMESILAAPPSSEDISMGGDLFQGTRRFENSGPACNACHDVTNDAVIGGGSLAVDLTSVFSKMGGAGLMAILSRPPFPVMQIAYNEKPLMENEVAALVVFFQSTEVESASQQETDYGLRLFLSGVLGAGFLFCMFPLIWRDRKIDSVNQSIYDRQVHYEQDEKG